MEDLFLLIRDYLRAAATVYGRISLGTLFVIFTHHNGEIISSPHFCRLALTAGASAEHFRIIGDDDIYRADIAVADTDRYVIHRQYCYATWDELFTLELSQEGKMLRIFTREEFLSYANPDYIPNTPQIYGLEYMLRHYSTGKIPTKKILQEALLLAANDCDAPAFIKEMQRMGCHFDSIKDRLLAAYTYKAVFDTVPKSIHNGNTELEMQTLPISEKPLQRYLLWFCSPREDDGFHLCPERLREDVAFTGETELRRYLSRCLQEQNLPCRLLEPCFCGSGLDYADCCGKR